MWIQTYTGRKFHLEDFSVNDICIEDIAHALSLTNRYGGHTTLPYTVAEHCCHVSDKCQLHHRLAGLLHDAQEAYIGDVVTPLKKAIGESYENLECAVVGLISAKFEIETFFLEDIVEADRRMVPTEVRDLFVFSIDDWVSQYGKPYDDVDVHLPWSPVKAEHQFLSRFQELVDARKT